jgi:hypothetical protein
VRKQSENIKYLKDPTTYYLKSRFYVLNFILILTTIVVISTFILCLASEKINQKLQTTSKQINLMNLFRNKSVHGQLNVVQVEYKFPKKQHVVVSSHGLVSGKGTLRFMTREHQLEFRDPTSEALLGTIKFNKHIELMAR